MKYAIALILCGCCANGWQRINLKVGPAEIGIERKLESLGGRLPAPTLAVENNAVRSKNNEVDTIEY